MNFYFDFGLKIKNGIQICGPTLLSFYVFVALCEPVFTILHPPSLRLTSSPSTQ
jgi:hypothetical protein